MRENFSSEISRVAVSCIFALTFLSACDPIGIDSLEGESETSNPAITRNDQTGLAGGDMSNVVTSPSLDLSEERLPVCRSGIVFSSGLWHRCESTGRWLGTKASTLEMSVPPAATELVIEGRFWGTRRSLKVTDDGTILYEGYLPNNQAVIPLQKTGVRVLTLDFDGEEPTSPSDIGREDDRKLVFMIMNWYTR